MSGIVKTKGVEDVKVNIICGFLGVGKTTLLRNLLAKSSEGTAVLINEFGEIGLDGLLVRQGQNISLAELPSGCVCCSLRRDLVEAVQEIREKVSPQRLIIEPSGIAAPSGILEALASPQLAGMLEIEAVVGIVDCTSFIENYESGMFGTFYLDQVHNSDIILLNKTDLVDGELLERTERLVRELNPAAVVLPTTYCQVNLPVMKHEKSTVTYGFKPDMQSYSVRANKIYEQNRIEQVLEQLKEGGYGEVYRAKGVFRTETGWIGFDFVQGVMSYQPIKESTDSRFIFIGKNLEKKLLQAAFS